MAGWNDCTPAGWSKWMVLIISAASLAQPASAQPVSGGGDIQPSPVQTPHWDTGGDLTVGDAASGTLTITDGGSVVNNDAYIGNLGSGTLTVSGSDGAGSASSWTSRGWAMIGNQAGSVGTVTILNGGVAQADIGSIGLDAGSLGTVTVSGRGSTWSLLSTNNGFGIGVGGSGRLRIDNGGAVHSGQALIGWDAGSDGIVTVSGQSSVWDPHNNIFVGFDGTGELHVLDGAAVSTAAPATPGNAATIYIGLGAGAVGTVTVSSATADISTLSATDRITVGSAGTGTLTIDKGGVATAASDTWIGIAPTSTGTLNLFGDATGRGVLATGSVIKGDGNVALNLDGGILRAIRDQNNFLNGFATQAVGNGGAWFDTNTYDVRVLTAFSGTSSLNKLGAGILTLSGDSSAFTGNTEVQVGTLQVDGTLGGPVNVLTGARLTGTGQVGTTTNNGTVAPGPRTGFGTLTIAGDYAGQGGNLEIRTQLGGDNSPTDRLVITGDSAGATPVMVKNMGGAGAATQRGIQVVQVNGISAGQFNLANGDYVINGRPALVAGAYGYVLQQDAADGSWYLRSSLIDPGTPQQGVGGAPVTQAPPLYQPGVPVYEAYANTLLQLSQLTTLRQRVGNRLYDPADTRRNGVWSRVEGATGRFDPSVSTTGQHQNIDSWKAQFGVDRILSGEQGGARLVGGLALHYGKADTRTNSAYGRGTIDTTAYGLMPTLTWYGKDGLYIDTQAHATWFDSDLDSRQAGQLKDGRKAQSYGLGIEAGKAFGVGEGFALVPQAQLTYVSTRFSSFDDKFGAHVESDKGNSLLGRLGIALDYKSNWQAGGVNRESSVYGIVNIKHEFLDGTRLRVADVPVSSRMARTWGSVGLGVNYGWAGRYALYGQVDADADFSGSYVVTATAGFRMMF
ncbi:autotransporter outer membrane beta-barrel domain-containing protein [Bordetella hinzii]|uniref:autotransporter family protein n=2 Tax=Bordetella hinzii TaxID=103855 RepID=UPI0011631272|nr:autotransporter outer membrane beta-barrel domain-containing protein [Bordetella hinzii]QDJ33319.1 autotransporter outer membrane beta-barrel domain-containing protein [Bordetella hinzii]WPL81623.1 autotransporter outer membrane beta-barrel domain-containing protein [Bordetella hinzii]